MASKKILMACTNYWTSPYQVGSHHLARQFARLGYEVAFISNPISPFHLLGGNSRDRAERFAIYRRGGIRDLDGKLWAYVPFALASPHNKPFLRSGWVQKNWSAFSWPNVVRKVVQQGFGEVDLLYFDSVAQSFWPKYIKARKSLFRIADNNQGFERATEAAREAEKELARKVDVVAYTAKSLKGIVAEMDPKGLLYLPNGVQFHHFAGPLPPRPIEYDGISGPIAIYVGAMEEWFHFDWIEKTASVLPEVTFILVGNPGSELKGRGTKNIRFLGSRPYSQIPAYLRHASVGLIPFDLEKHAALIDHIHPLKLYEYMACGLPVVATAWKELKSLKSPAYLCGTGIEFTKNLQRALKDRGRDRYIRYAQKQDWTHRAKPLAEFLK